MARRVKLNRGGPTRWAWNWILHFTTVCPAYLPQQRCTSATLHSWVEETWTGLCIENKEKIRSCLQGIHKYYTSSSGETTSEKEKFVWRKCSLNQEWLGKSAGSDDSWGVLPRVRSIGWQKRIMGEKKTRRELRGSECGWHRTPELSQPRAAQDPHTSAAWKESGGLAKSSDEDVGAGLEQSSERGAVLS